MSDSDGTGRGEDDTEPSAAAVEPTADDGKPAESEEIGGDEAAEYEPSIAGVFGARSDDAPPRPEIVPESPDPENVLFVLLGVLLGIAVIYRAVVVFVG